MMSVEWKKDLAMLLSVAALLPCLVKAEGMTTGPKHPNMSERNDLAQQHPDRIRSLVQELGHWEVNAPNPVFREPATWRVRHLSFYDLDK